jgi:hypothetical protein
MRLAKSVEHEVDFRILAELTVLFFVLDTRIDLRKRYHGYRQETQGSICQGKTFHNDIAKQEQRDHFLDGRPHWTGLIVTADIVVVAFGWHTNSQRRKEQPWRRHRSTLPRR